MRLIRAEILKLVSTRLFWGLLATATGVAVFLTALGAVLAGEPGADAPPLTEPDGVYSVLSAGAFGILFAMIIGAAVITVEYRHNTITTTFLITPRRWRVVAAKLAASALAGAAYGVATSLAALTVLLVALTLRAIPLAVLDAPAFALLGGGVLALALYALLGLAVGALVRNQAAAIAITFAWILIIEQLLSTVLPGITAWLPGGAVTSLYVLGREVEETLLPAWAAVLLLGGYAVACVAIATATTIRRDIT